MATVGRGEGPGRGTAARRGRGAPGPQSHSDVSGSQSLPDGAGPRVIFKHLPPGPSPGRPSPGPRGAVGPVAEAFPWREGPCRWGSWKGSGWRVAPRGLQRQTPLSRGPRGREVGGAHAQAVVPEPCSTSPPAGRVACDLPPCPTEGAKASVTSLPHCLPFSHRSE